MKQKIFTLLLMALVLLFLGSTSAYSVTTDELKRQIDSLSGKVDDLKKKNRRMRGAPSEDQNKVSVFGYGELHGTIQEGENQLDNHRFVIGIHAPLADWVHLNAEIDFEHASQELEFELAHLDFLVSSTLNFKTGVMLMPVGALNEFHEPNRFYTVERPYLQSQVIPSTWSAGGAGIFGSSGGMNYRLYIVNSLQSVKQAGASSGSGNGNGGCDLQFKDTSGIRSGRGQINKRCFENVAATGRVEWPMLAPGLSAGASFFAGNTTQGKIDEGGFMGLLEGDINYRKGWFEMNSTIVNITIEDAAEINQFAQAEGTASGAVGDRIFGMNIQTAIHIPQLMGKQTKQDWIAHAMYESIDTQASLSSCLATAAGATNCAVDGKASRDIVTFGITYKPIPAVALKLDRTTWWYGNETSKYTTNIGVAYMY